MQVSDQDFFFDEDETAAPKPKASKPAASSKPASRQAAPAPAGVQSVSMTVAALIGVIALLAGLIIGVLLPIGNTASTATSTTATTGATTSGSSAPQLTQDQLNSGQLPAGHPDISGAASSTATSGTGK